MFSWKQNQLKIKRQVLIAYLKDSAIVWASLVCLVLGASIIFS
jgi:hypothetical protein